MTARVLAIALNTYREAVRARVLLGVFALGLATSAYSIVVAALSQHNELRVVADLGAAALSLYAVLVAIVLGSTSLYRELEHKTIFPILSRPIRRWEYVLGKYFGALITVAVFVALEAGVVLALVAIEAGQPTAKVIAVLGVMACILVPVLIRARHARIFAVIPWAVAFAVAAWWVAAPAPEERRFVAASSVLSICEVAVVAGVATLFASFSSPFLTATFTAMVFIIGRSADTLAHLPKKLFGPAVGAVGQALARVLPNLHVYVPPRPLLLGQVAGEPVWRYVAVAALQAVSYSVALVVVAAVAFRKRDFS